MYLKNPIVSSNVLTSLVLLPLWHRDILLGTNSRHQLNKQVTYSIPLWIVLNMGQLDDGHSPCKCITFPDQEFGGMYTN